MKHMNAELIESRINVIKRYGSGWVLDSILDSVLASLKLDDYNPKCIEYGYNYVWYENETKININNH